jgi:acetyl-CoA carboxylase biotin carboxyl carrier protein
MEITELEELVQLLRESNAGELTLRHEGERITIRKATRSASPSVALTHGGEEYRYDTQYADVVDDDVEIATEHEQSVLVTAPLVGVFRHVKPLIGLNARVEEGQVVGVIEAMKLITEINAPASGVIVDRFIEDGHPVEFGQALFEIQAG